MNKLVDTIDRQAQKYGNREAYRFCWRKDGEWLSTGWSDFRAQVNVAAYALAILGTEEKDTIAICSPNTPQILVAEFGGFNNRLAAIPVYSGSSQEQFDFIVSNGGARIIFVGDKHQYPLAYNYWKRNPDKVAKIVVFKNSGFDFEPDDKVSILWDDFVRLGMEAPEEIKSLVSRRREAGLPDDPATLIYHPEPPGNPKEW